ncbi:MAG: DUF2752 domain-containing protein [Rikenellaceae bacterium]|nr:DUF2752 domain-containing protein [Rikenellaceae bacterium]MDE7134820.1 DUF2752 domain-containing protein [Rikenellaceae bacterium]MDE7356284.1 DUF2752 domain-containing protein [Rikenellaceae bacterium]
MPTYKKVIILSGILAFGAILVFFNPEDSIWFPKCFFYVLTGYECPACGVQRAAYQLIHLNFRQAFAYNPFLVISGPYALLLIIVTWIAPKDKLVRLRNICLHRITVNIYLVLMTAWWILRNII